MSGNSKLSLEERLKLATQSGGKKKGKGKKNSGSRNVTPLGSATPEPETSVVDDVGGINEVPEVIETVEDADQVKELVEEDPKVLVIVEDINQSEELAEEVPEVIETVEDADQAKTVAEEVPTVITTAEDINQSKKVDDEVSEVDIAESEEAETSEKQEQLTQKVDEAKETKKSDLEDSKVEKVIETAEPELNINEGKEETQMISDEPPIVKESPVIELNLSKDFMLQFNLSQSYYKNLHDQEVLNSLQAAIIEKFNDLQEKNLSEIQKVNKREAKLTTQVSTLQKDKVKTDLKFEKINNELNLTKKKLSTASTELENIKPKFEEINNEYTNVQIKLSEIEKGMSEKDQTIKALQIKLDDTTSSLNNYKLDNDSYASRESELIDEIVTLKGKHEKELAILESKIEQHKAKLEDMNLKISYDADEFFRNENITKEVETLNEKIRDQNDMWLNKYQSLSKENNEFKKVLEEIKSENEQNVSKIQSLNSEIEELVLSKTTLEDENTSMKESLTKLQNETSMRINQINKLKIDLKSANELNKVHSKQLQAVIKKNLKQIETKKASFVPGIKTPDVESIHEKEALNLQLRDEWNIENSHSNWKFLESHDDLSEDGSMASSLNFSFKSPENNNFKSFNFKNRHNNSLPSQQLLDIDEEDPLLQRKSSDAALTPSIPTDSNNANMNLVARLNNKIRSLEYHLEFYKHSKERAAAEKIEQQRKLSEMERRLDELKTFEQVNSDLIKEKSITSQKFEYFENEIKMKNRRIMELTEDLKDMKELMHHQIQEIMSAADK